MNVHIIVALFAISFFFGCEDVEPAEEPAKSQWLQKKCDQEDVASCHRLAMNITSGSKTPEEALAATKKAMPYYEKTCALGNGIGCSMYASAIQEFPDYDQKEALEYHGKACNLKLGFSCAELGIILTTTTNDDLYDFDAGVDALKLACRGDVDKPSDTACAFLALYQLQGRTGPADKENAIQTLKDFCPKDMYQDLCLQYYLHTPDKRLLNKLEMSAFALHGYLGLVAHEGTEKTPKNPAEAYRLFSSACSENVPTACYLQAQIAKSDEERAELVKKACAGTRHLGCEEAPK